MASVTPPAKIILKSSTKISLNDRFSSIMKTGAKNVQTVRAQVARERLASEKNRRLAKQMENRPSVAAALGGSGVRGGQTFMADTTKPVQQRLGLTNTGRGARARGRGGNRALSRGGAIRGLRRGVSSRNSFSPRQRGQQTRSNRARAGRGGANQSFNARSPTRGAGGGQRGNRGQRGGRGRGAGGRGRRGARGGPRQPVEPASKQDLDSQLDSYMAHTKGSLDRELDSYMAQNQ